jgi:hypothetical protein
MINRHFHFIGNADIEEIKFCGENIGWVLSSKDGIFIPPTEMQPIEGEHNLNTCEGCQKLLIELTKRLNLWIEGKHKEDAMPFPYCCKWHRQLLKVKEFNRAYFDAVPEVTAKKIIYTYQLIINKHKSESWYKAITDYIELTLESFGQMPNGCGAPVFLSDYIFYVTDLLKRNKEINAEKKGPLLDFLYAYLTPIENTKTDFNILLGTYQKWLKEFPFELNSYFGNLKQHFEKQLPILNGLPEINIYSGTAKAKMHTKSSLVEALINLTNSLLTQINAVTLYEKGLISDVNKIKLELVINSRKLKLKQGYKNSSSNEEQRYRRIIKEWFNDEKKFIDEITPLLKALPTQQAETKTDKLKMELGKYGFFELPKVKKLSELNKQSLTELISTNGLPYSIAMFEYLEFLKHLESKHFNAKYRLNREVAKWLNSDKEGRSVKGNISSLSEYSNEDRRKYTAYTHKETVKTDYQKLK